MTPSFPYIDTSALLKWYLPEPFSDEFAQFVESRESAQISSLSITEFHCSVARRERNRMLTPQQGRKVVRAFSAHVAAGHLTVLPVRDEYLTHATELIDTMKQPLRTLDALHLAIADASGCRQLATADKMLAAAARAIGFQVHTFF